MKNKLKYVWNNEQKKIINKKLKLKPYPYLEENIVRRIARRLFSKEAIQKDLAFG